MDEEVPTELWFVIVIAGVISIGLFLYPIVTGVSPPMTLQEANDEMEKMPQDMVLLGAWSRSVTFETKIKAFTICKFSGDEDPSTVFGYKITRGCDFNWKAPIENLGITHVITEVPFNWELKWLNETYPYFWKYSKPVKVLEVGNRVLLIYEITGTLEELKNG